MELLTDHPKQKLLFYIYSDFDESAVEALRDHILKLDKGRSWVLSGPAFVNFTDEPTNKELDRGIRTVGGVIEIYSGLPPWNAKLPVEIDRALFNDVKAIVESMVHFSRERGVDIGFELDGVDVGWIVNGILDELLQEGLLGEWRRSVGETL
jgi:hypothetical protein